MIEFNFLKEEFVKRHGNIDNDIYLDKYLSLLINYEKDDNTIYYEKHHILPRSTFPNYEKELWNIIDIDYETHKLSHLYLFKAINDRKYQRPLNWMMKYYKNSEEISNAAKRGWINLKNNEEGYKRWKDSKSESMKKLTSEEQKRRSDIFWKNINEENYLIFCNNMKSYWTEDKKIEKSKQMNEYYSNFENIEKRRKETQDRWDNLDNESRLKFRDKMSIINKNENKRIDAGIKIKKKWEDPEYLGKMKNRGKRNGLKIKITKSTGDIEIFENMEDIVRKYNFSTHLIRKYRNTNNKVLEIHLNENNIHLLDSIIEITKE